MKVVNFGDQARRWAENAAEAIRGLASDESEDGQPTAVELWNKAAPQLETALTFYDKKNSGSLPDSAWLSDSKTRCQKEIDKVIDAVILLLEKSGAAECRNKIRALQSGIAVSRERIGQYREQAFSAPPQASLSPPSSLWTRSRESIEAAIATEVQSIEEMAHQIGQLKEEFRNQLRRINLEVSADEVDSILLPVQDDIVSMAAAITNIAGLTAQLERLVEESGEIPSHTRRYYGIYVLLVYAIDRIQTHFIEEIDETYIPRLHSFEQQALENIAEAQIQISQGGPRDQLGANAEAGKTTIKACQVLGDALRKQRNAVSVEGAHTRRMLAAAANTYKTVRLSLNVAELMSDCQAAFRALRDLQVPQLRPFKNLELKAEMQRLAERMLDKEV